jgi:hypothetical protein
MEHAVVTRFEALVEGVIGLVPAPIAPPLFHFVVATPQSERGVVAQATYVFEGFYAKVLEEIGVRGVNATGKHEILRDGSFLSGNWVTLFA